MSQHLRPPSVSRHSHQRRRIRSVTLGVFFVSRHRKRATAILALLRLCATLQPSVPAADERSVDATSAFLQGCRARQYYCRRDSGCCSVGCPRSPHHNRCHRPARDRFRCEMRGLALGCSMWLCMLKDRAWAANSGAYLAADLKCATEPCKPQPPRLPAIPSLWRAPRPCRGGRGLPGALHSPVAHR